LFSAHQPLKQLNVCWIQSGPKQRRVRKLCSQPESQWLTTATGKSSLFLLFYDAKWDFSVVFDITKLFIEIII